MFSFPNLELVCCSMSGSSCCFLNCTQISQEVSQVLRYFHLFRNFPQFVVIHTVKGFGIVNKTEVDTFLEFSYFFKDPTHVANLISGSSAFSKSSLNIWKFKVHILWKPSLENFEHYVASMWFEWNCVVVWTFFGIALLWDWNEHWPFPVLWPLLSFPNLLAYWVQHFFFLILLYNTVLVLPDINMNVPRVYMSSQSWVQHFNSIILGFEIAQLEFHHLH